MTDTTTTAVRIVTDPAELLASLRAQATTERYDLPDDATYFAQSHLADMAYPVRVRQLIERAIIRRAVIDILAVQAEHGPAYTVSVYDGEDTPLAHSRELGAIMAAIMATDEDYLVVRRAPAPGSDRRPHFGNVRLVYGGDGWDVVSDYHVTLEDALKGANALADALGDLL